MRINELPTYTVQAIEHDRVRGCFTDDCVAEERWMGERHVGYLVTPEERFIPGRFIDVDMAAKTATFLPQEPKGLGALQLDKAYRRIDGYWGERAALVLDRNRVWAERAFEAADAIVSKGGVMRIASSDAVGSGEALVKGGWDHEHCDICWARISRVSNPIALFSEPRYWLCAECYTKYVVPRSLGFIGE